MTTLRWDAQYLATAMPRKGILGRAGLAALPGMSKATVYRSFNSDWSGEVTTAMLARLSVLLRVPPGRLVKDPRRVAV